MDLALIPPPVLRLIASTSDVNAFGPTKSEDAKIADIKAASARLPSDKVEDMTIVSEIFRQHSNGRLLFTVEHMGRFARKLETIFGDKTGNTVVCGRSFNAVSRLLEAHKGNVPANGRSIGLVAWAVGTEQGAKIIPLAYLINTPQQYPATLADDGVVVSIAFTDDKTPPLDPIHSSSLVFDTILVNSKGVAYDAVKSRVMCAAEGAAVVPLDYTPTGSDEEILGMSVALVGLRSACDKVGIDFRTVDLSVGHIAFADCVALVSDDHDMAPVKQILISVKDKDKVNPAFMPAFTETEEWLVLNKDSKLTGVVDTLNAFICQKGYQWGDDLNSACAQQ